MSFREFVAIGSVVPRTCPGTKDGRTLGTPLPKTETNEKTPLPLRHSLDQENEYTPGWKMNTRWRGEKKGQGWDGRNMSGCTMSAERTAEKWTALQLAVDILPKIQTYT